MRLKVKKTSSVDLLAKLQEAAKSPEELLARMGSYVRAVAVEKIESGDGIAPWAESTRKKYEQRGTGKVTSQGRVRASAAKRLDQYFKRKGNDEARRELADVIAGSAVKPKNKTVAALQRKLERAKKTLAKGAKVNIGKRQSENRTVLGGLARAFGMHQRGSSIMVVNHVKNSGVLQTGGTVGNGARLPERRFLDISSATRQRLANICLDHFLR